MEITQGVAFESFGLSEATLRAIRNKGDTVSTPVHRQDHGLRYPHH